MVQQVLLFDFLVDTVVDDDDVVDDNVVDVVLNGFIVVINVFF